MRKLALVGCLVIGMGGCASWDAFRTSTEGRQAIGSGINAGAGLLKDVVPFPFNQLIGPAGSLLTLVLTGGRKP